MESIMNRLFNRILFMATLLSLFNIASANDGLLGIETNQPSTGRPIELERALIDIRLPSRGMSKQRVESAFGSPIDTRAAVGEPPISSWLYAEFTVYFESEWVLHSVLNRTE